MPPSECSQSASVKSASPPPKASMTMRRASSRVSLSRSAVWTRRAVITWVVTPKVSTRSGTVAEGPSRTRPVQAHRLARPYLRDPVDVLVDHHADDGITAGDWMVRAEDDGKTVRRHLNRSPGGAFARQLAIAVPVLKRHADQTHADAIAAVGDLPVGADEHVGFGEPVVARTRHHRQFDDVVGDRGHRGLLEFGKLLGVVADRQHVARLQWQRPDGRHHV